MYSQIDNLVSNGIKFVNYSHDNKDIENTDNIDKNSNNGVENDTFEISNSDLSPKTYTHDTLAAKKAVAEVNAKYASLQNLVNNLFQKQGKVGLEADWDSLIKTGKLGGSLKTIKIDIQTQLKAQSDISKNGYWGINKTSTRIVNFAKALTGGDKSKADKMFEAFKKGYSQAVHAFGGKDTMPSICQSTYDEVVKKFEDWENSSEDESKAFSQSLKNQIAAQGIASLF